jgi:hypothetical protein
MHTWLEELCLAGLALVGAPVINKGLAPRPSASPPS